MQLLQNNGITKSDKKMLFDATIGRSKHRNSLIKLYLVGSILSARSTQVESSTKRPLRLSKE